MNISSHLPDMVDQYISLRAQRLAKEKEAAEIKETEELLKTAIISKAREQELTAVGSKLGIVKVKCSKEPKADDWALVYEHIQKTGQFELLHKRLAILAIKEHVDAGETIPGIAFSDVYSLSVSQTK